VGFETAHLLENVNGGQHPSDEHPSCASSATRRRI
jgi:hypothetical protein